MKDHQKESKKKFSIMLLADLYIIALGIFLDIWTKKRIINHASDLPKDLIPGVLQFRYIENKGAAFGMLQEKQTLFAVIFIIVCLAIVYLLIKLPNEKKYHKLHIIFSFIIAGAIGNSIDRFKKGSVTDFIYFYLIDFPIFNVADIFITCSTILLILFILFAYKEEDFDFLKKKKTSSSSNKEK